MAVEQPYRSTYTGGQMDELLADAADVSQAVTDAQAAQTAAETAQTGAETAQAAAESSASAASGSATAASGSALAASGSADAAALSASAASTSAETAATSATSADGSAEDAEAWAVGQRDGVDVGSTDPAYHNNAKYYKEQAGAIAGSKVDTFNGRSGAVTPQSGDYTIDQITGATASRVLVSGPSGAIAASDITDAELEYLDGLTGNVQTQINNALSGALNGWNLLQSYTTAGTYTFTAPDLFGGLDYEVGVCIIGGGGSGAAVAYAGTSAGEQDFTATGGGSGHIRCITMTVTPGQTYTVVVGAGGAAVSAAGSTAQVKKAGNAGGTSSFAGVPALGGGAGNSGGVTSSYIYRTGYSVLGAEGGQASDGFGKGGSYCIYGNAASLQTCPPSSQAARGGGYTASYYHTGTSTNTPSVPVPDHDADIINMYTGDYLLLCGGMARSSAAQTAATNTMGVQGSSGVYSTSGNATATKSTAPGAGGGAAATCLSSATSTTATSAAGNSGAVMIYVRGEADAA